MRQKYVPIEKQSKRKQKEFHAAQRRDWGGINPATQKVPNLKAYNRKKSKHGFDHEPCLDFFILAKISNREIITFLIPSKKRLCCLCNKLQ